MRLGRQTFGESSEVAYGESGKEGVWRGLVCHVNQRNLGPFG